MNEQAATIDHPASNNAEQMSRLWWLWLPLGIAVLLAGMAQATPDTYDKVIGGELGLLEFFHFAVPFASMIVALRTLFLPQLRRQRWLFAWVGLAALGSLFVSGEEASWGQHYFNWATPESWQAVNDQGETNLHNTSAWFDQKPRTLLEIGIIVGGLIIPLVALRRPKIRQSRFAIILPPLLCLPAAALAEFVRMLERAISAFGSHAYLFSRASEVQELYFYIFILLYMIVLRRRIEQDIPRQI